MKTNYKTLITISVVFVALFGTGVAANAQGLFGKNRESKVAMPQGDKLGLFCKNIDKLDETLTNKMSERDGNVQDRRQEREQLWEQKKSDVINKLDGIRNEVDTKREEHYAKLLEAATTQEQKDAIEVFKSAVEEAVEAKRAAINSANATYKNAVEQLRTNRQTQVNAAVEVYRSEVKAAFAKAKTACGSGDQAQIRETLRSEIKTAREKLKTTLEGLKIKADLETLRKARQTSIQQATETFRQTLEAAKIELKKAFN